MLSYYFLLPLVVVLGCFVFFLADNFMIYTVLLLEQEVEGIQLEDQGNVWADYSGNYGSDNGSGINSGIREAIDSLYFSAMSPGYYKDYLQIVSDHVTGEKMREGYEVPTRNDGSEVKIGVHHIMGMSVAETGIANNTSPKTTLGISLYKAGTSYTLSQFSSAFVKAQGLRSLGDGFSVNATISGNNSYTGPFQIHKSYLRYYPYSENTAESIWGYSSSSMVGYGLETKRGWGHTDAVYFPDQVEFTIDTAVSHLRRETDINSLSNDGVIMAIYATHNMGNSHAWAYNSSSNSALSVNGWNSKNTVTWKECASSAFNISGAMAKKASEYIAKHYERAEARGFNMVNHPDYTGLAAVMLIADGGFLATQSVVDRFWYLWGTAGFKRGAILGYEIYFNDPLATEETVKAWLDKTIKVQPIDTAFYGPARTDNTGGAGGVGLVIHRYNDSLKVYNDAGAGPKPVLHAFMEAGYRGGFMAETAGVYCYWKMLNASGVEVSYADAYNDVNNLTRIKELFEVPDGSYYWGTRDVGYFTSEGDTSDDAKVGLSSLLYYRDGSMHYGEDHLVPSGTELVALMDGVVDTATWDNSYGYYIRVTSDSMGDEPKVQYLYAHCTSLKKKAGDRVREGDVIAISGNTGLSGGPHLHIEMRVTKNQPDGKGSAVYHMSYYGIDKSLYSLASGPQVIRDREKTTNWWANVYGMGYKKLGNLCDDYAECGGKNKAKIPEQGINYFKESAKVAWNDYMREHPELAGKIR